MIFKNWDLNKAKKIIDFLDASQWGKTFSIGLRLLFIIIVILGITYSIAYYQILKKRPVVPINIESYLKAGKSVRIKLDGDYFEIDSKEGMKVTDSNGNLKKRIKVEDIPVLSESLKPIAWERPNLVGIYGLGFGSTVQIEYGIGMDMLRAWKVNLGAILTNKAGYIEGGYKIDKTGFVNLENTSIILGTGYTYNGERQNIVGLKIRF